MSALAFVTVIAVGASVIAFRPAPAAPEMRVEITTPATTDPVSLAISPDGRTIAFVATDNNQSRLWLRSLDTASARSFAGTDGATLPFWSPDSRALGFFAAGKLKRIDLEGGAVWTLANASDARGGAWSRDGVILFSPNAAGPLFRISSTGGSDPVQVTDSRTLKGGHRLPQFLPDGRRIVFSSNRQGPLNLYVKSVNGAGSEDLLLPSPNTILPTDWSRDGRFILYDSRDPQTGLDIWALPLDGDKKPFEVVRTNFEERIAQFSPDGKWIAYQSNESGRYEIYVQPFPGPGTQVADLQRRRRSSAMAERRTKLFFVGLDGKFMAVNVRPGSDAQSLDAGLPAALIPTHIIILPTDRAQYVVSLDGQRFVPLGQSSSVLTIPEMTDLIEYMFAWGAENNVRWSDPALRGYEEMIR